MIQKKNRFFLRVSYGGCWGCWDWDNNCDRAEVRSQQPEVARRGLWWGRGGTNNICKCLVSGTKLCHLLRDLGLVNCVILNKLQDLCYVRRYLERWDIEMWCWVQCQCVVTQNITVPSPSPPPLTPELSSHLDKLSYHDTSGDQESGAQADNESSQTLKKNTT